MEVWWVIVRAHSEGESGTSASRPCRYLGENDRMLGVDRSVGTGRQLGSVGDPSGSTDGSSLRDESSPVFQWKSNMTKSVFILNCIFKILFGDTFLNARAAVLVLRTT